MRKLRKSQTKNYHCILLLYHVTFTQDTAKTNICYVTCIFVSYLPLCVMCPDPPDTGAMGWGAGIPARGSSPAAPWPGLCVPVSQPAARLPLRRLQQGGTTCAMCSCLLTCDVLTLPHAHCATYSGPQS